MSPSWVEIPDGNLGHSDSQLKGLKRYQKDASLVGGTSLRKYLTRQIEVP